MRFLVRAFACAKEGSSASEYEDDIRWNRGARGRRAARRYAVADGASESSFARAWAGLLTQAYVHGRLAAESLVADLAPFQERWLADVSARPLPWYAVEKTKAGAFAALAGLTLYPGGRWSVLAVGDCCVLHVRDGELLRSFPMEDAEAFSRRPLLIGSNPARNERLPGAVLTACGDWRPDDTFLLMSDAIAAYVIGEVTGSGRPVGEILPPSDFQSDTFQWVQRLRAEGRLRNDDVSMLAIHVLEPSPDQSSVTALGPDPHHSSLTTHRSRFG